MRARVSVRFLSYTGGFDAPYSATFDGYSQLQGPNYQTGTATVIARDGSIITLPMGFVAVQSKTAVSTFEAHAALCKSASVPMADVAVRVLDKVSRVSSHAGVVASDNYHSHFPLPSYSIGS